MKTLVLVRHAKSAWDAPGLADHERPLAKRGLRDAPEMGRRLAERGLEPDVIRSSTAVRARTTAELIAEGLGLAPDRLDLDERLYGASPEDILDVVREFDDAVGTAMVVAHDPGMSDLAFALSGTIEHMPTCAIAEFRFDVASWPEAVEAEPVDTRIDTPR
jgi:phosphohistidine phosphatase